MYYYIILGVHMCMMLHVVPCTSVSVHIVHVGGVRGVSENAIDILV